MFGNIPWNEYVRARAFLTHEEVNVLQRTEEASLDIALGDQVCPLDRASPCPPPPPQKRTARDRKIRPLATL